MRQARTEASMNEHTAVEISATTYCELLGMLRMTGNTSTPQEIVELAVKVWIAATSRTAERQPCASIRGYQWKSLFLPEGTALRMQYRGEYHYAEVRGDAIIHDGMKMSPRK